MGAGLVTPKVPRASPSHLRTPSCGIGCGDRLVTGALLAAQSACQARVGPRRSGQEQSWGWGPRRGEKGPPKRAARPDPWVPRCAPPPPAPERPPGVSPRVHRHTSGLWGPGGGHFLTEGQSSRPVRCRQAACPLPWLVVALWPPLGSGVATPSQLREEAAAPPPRGLSHALSGHPEWSFWGHSPQAGAEVFMGPQGLCLSHAKPRQALASGAAQPRPSSLVGAGLSLA